MMGFAMDTIENQEPVKTYRELLEERKALDEKLAVMRREATQSAVRQVREIIETYDLTEADVFGRGAARGIAEPSEKRPVAPKYRDPVTGQTWTGRGKPPRWIAGVENRDEYLIAA
ncbi:H-NS histone family protein [Melaminivora jejuensis]